MNKSKSTPKSKKASVVETSSAGSEKKAVVENNYTGYFYNQIERLWQEVITLQQENTKLKAQMKGEF